MADGSVAPKERVNITYKSSTDGGKDIELPNKLLVIGDFTLREDDQEVEERAKVNVNKDNFNDVMAKQELSLDFMVKDKLKGPLKNENGEVVLDEDGNEQYDELRTTLDIKNISSFNPEQVAGQVEELRKLLELRDALAFLKGPLGNIPAFRKQIDKLLDDSDSRQKLMKELGIDE